MTEAAVNQALGGVALPQPGIHISGVPRQVVLPLSGRLERTDDGCTSTGQGVSWTLARNFQKMGTGRDMEFGELSEAFAEEWSLAIADAALRTA